MSSLKRYHYNTITNRMNKCNAVIRCPLGGVPHVQADNVGDAKILYEVQYKDAMKNESYLGKTKREERGLRNNNMDDSPNLVRYLSKNDGVLSMVKPPRFYYYHGETISEIRENVIKDYVKLAKKYNGVSLEMAYKNLKENVNKYIDTNYTPSEDNHMYKSGVIYRDINDVYYKTFTYDYIRYHDKIPEPPFEHKDDLKEKVKYKKVNITRHEKFSLLDKDRITYSYPIPDKEINEGIAIEEVDKLYALSYSIENIKHKSLPDWVVMPPMNISQESEENLRGVAEMIRQSKKFNEYNGLSDSEFYDKFSQEKNFYLPYNEHNTSLQKAETAGDILKESFIKKLSAYYPHHNDDVKREQAEKFVKENPESIKENIAWLEDHLTFEKQLKSGIIFTH